MQVLRERTNQQINKQTNIAKGRGINQTHVVGVEKKRKKGIAARQNERSQNKIYQLQKTQQQHVAENNFCVHHHLWIFIIYW